MAYNSFHASAYCSPAVYVGWDESFLNSEGGSHNYIRKGDCISVSKWSTSSNPGEVYGYASVTYTI